MEERRRAEEADLGLGDSGDLGDTIGDFGDRIGGLGDSGDISGISVGDGGFSPPGMPTRWL
eukprot:1862303-Rhodomonas_salina.2